VPLRELTDFVEEIRELSDDVLSTDKEAFSSWPPYTWRDEGEPGARACYPRDGCFGAVRGLLDEIACMTELLEASFDPQRGSQSI
jgi:hypothetical protein